MAYRKRPLKLRTPVVYCTRSDRPTSRGLVAGYHDTLRGMFVRVKDSQTGVTHKVRLANVMQAA